MSDIDLDLGHTRLIIEACKEHELLRNQAAYVLATAYWESARTMEPVKEAFWLSEQWRKKNLHYYPYYGRGYVQLTWESNYRFASNQIGDDLVSNPDLALVPEDAMEILVLGCRDGWFTRAHKTNGWDPGYRLENFITLQKSNFVEARKIVNGMDKANTIAGIAEDYDAMLVIEGYGVDDKPELRSPDDILDEYITHPEVNGWKYESALVLRDN